MRCGKTARNKNTVSLLKKQKYEIAKSATVGRQPQDLKGKLKPDLKEQITVMFLFCGKEKEKGFGVPKPLCFIYYILRLISYPLPFNPYPLTPP